MDGDTTEQQQCLTLMTVNINGLSESSSVLLDSYLTQMNVDVTSITETKKDSLPSDYFSHSSTYHKNDSENPTHQGGTAMVVNNNIQLTEVPFHVRYS